MTTDSHLFHTREELETGGWTLNGNVFERPLPDDDGLITDRQTDRQTGRQTDRQTPISDYRMERMMPLYEAKMIHHYDTRWATYESDGTTRLMAEDEKQQRLLPMPRCWVHESEIDKKLDAVWGNQWLFGYRGICRATDERTVISTLLPHVGVGNSIVLMLLQASQARHLLSAAMSSFVFDYVARQKVGGTNLNFFLMQQFAIPSPETTVSDLHLPKSLTAWLATAVDRLNAWTTTLETRAHLRAELDALMFHVYGVGRDDVDYIMETFPIVKRKDEATHGEYRTKSLILAAYDAMVNAIANGTIYESPFEEAEWTR